MKKIITLLLVALFALTLASCAPKDPADAKSSLEGKGYSVVVDGTIIPAGLSILGAEGAKSAITASKKINEGKDDEATITVVAIYFDTKDHATSSRKAIEDYAKNNGEKSEIKQSGQWLYYGDAQAMKDFA